MKNHPLILEVRKLLKENADEATKAGSARFFKPNEKVNVYGVKTPIARKIAAQTFAKLKATPKKEVFELCERLWQAGVMEESFVACEWSYRLRKQYEPDDFSTFERWVEQYVSNWAECDTLCNHTVGTFVEMYPKYVQTLKKWAKSDNRWVKRAAGVTLIIPARKGLFLKEIFEIATILLHDEDDIVQKGYGWMLKAASESYQQEVYEFVLKHKQTMPRTALRYAIEKMPKELKAKAMAK